MRFLHPLAWWYGAFPLLLMLLYLLQRPPRTYWVSNRYLWPQVAQPVVWRWRFTVFTHEWLLWLQLLFMALVLLALMQPVLLSRSAQGRRLAFIFDASASMHTVEGGRSRFVRAREAALSVLGALAENDQVLIVQAQAQPLVVSDFQRDRRRLREQIQGLFPLQTPADLNAALVYALSVAEEVHLFSDGAANAAPPATLPAARVHYHQVGESANNVAITRLSVRNNALSPYDQAIFAELVNFSGRTHTVRFGLSMGETSLREETITLGPGARQALITEHASAAPGVITARLAVADDLEVDNGAYALAGVVRPLRVLMVSEGHLFIEKALDASPLVTKTVISPAAFGRREGREAYEVVILDGLEPPPGRQGRYLVLKPPAGTLRAAESLPVRHPQVTTRHPQHPLLAFIDVRGLAIEQALPLRIPAGGTVLLEGDEQPLLVAYEREDLRLVAIGFDFRASNLPLTVPFPVLLSNIIQWLGSPPAHERAQFKAGDPVRWAVPAAPGTAAVTVTDPQGRRVTRTLTDGVLTFEGTVWTGLYTIRGPAYEQGFVVNLFDEAESNIAPVAFSTPATPSQPGPGSGLRPGEVSLWPYLLVAAALVLVVEWGYYWQRRFR